MSMLKERTHGLIESTIFLRLTEPNGNPIWVQASQIACMYRQVHKSGGDERQVTMLVMSGVKVPVTEPIEEIIAGLR